jgi:replicative DNA helicase
MSVLALPTRIPPHNLDAERAVLGAILLEGRETLPRVIEVLRPSDFYTEANRATYSTMLRLFDRGEPVDLLTLQEELRRSDQLEFVGGPAALALLVEQASVAVHLMAYAQIVRDMAVLRELIQTSTQIITQAFEAKEDVQALVDDAERRIFSLAERRLLGSALPIGKILKNTFEYIERLYERKEHVTGIATGFEKLDLETSGLQPSDFIIIAGRPSMGKAQPLDAKVKTVTGWKRMGDLRLGDELASVDGGRSLVSGIFPQGRRQVYRVTFSDGRSMECCDEHLWRVHYRGWREPRTLTTERVSQMLRVKRYQHRLWIDVPSGVHGHGEALPIDPWVLGALLGDGKLSGTSLIFSTSDAAMLEQLLERTREGFALRAVGGYDWRIVQATGAHRRGIQGVSPNRLMEALRGLGLWGIRSDEKFIPGIYLNASREARLDVLRGLMDTDGWVERWGSARFCSTSERLAGNVAELVRSLGGWCSVRARRTTYRYRGEKRAGKRAFVCNVHYPAPKTIFGLAVKRDRALTAPRRRWRPVFVSVEPTRVTDTQCIAVTHPSRLYVTDDYVVTHNTAFALNVAQHVGIHLRGRVLVLSLEMSAQQIVQRMLCAEAKVDSQAVRTGYLSSSDWHRLTAAAGRLSEASIFIDDSPGLTVLEARAKARRMKAEHGLELLIIDYLQLMRGRAAMESRQQEISEISRSLKALAKELNVPVVALSQLSRAVESRATRDFRPQLSDLRECVTGDTLVVLGDGRRVPIRDLVGTAPEVLAMSPAGKIVTAKSERIWRVGVRPVFLARLASGRTIRATEQHRLFSGRGWMTVSRLAVGDRLAIARRLPEPVVPDHWPDCRLVLLGHLIGDGSYLSGQPLRYTTASEENSAIVSEEKLLADRRANTNVDTLPRESFERVKRLMRAQGISQRRMAALRGTAYGGSSHFRFAPSREVVQQYADILDDPELRVRATSGLFWDRIVSIEPAGEEEVFDLTVPGPASWLADGIVSHNSGALEQDADLILFLYRQSLYKEDLPPDEVNIADVIIGKQRNGPVGTVKVVFLPQYARFENVADYHRQPQPF